MVHTFLKASSSFTFTSGWLWGSSRGRKHSWWLPVCQHRKMTSNFHSNVLGVFAFFGRNRKLQNRAKSKTAASSKTSSMGKELPRLLQSWWFRLSETAWLPFLEERVAVFYSQEAIMSFLICKNKMQWHSTWKQWAAGKINQLFSPEQPILIGENQFSERGFICKRPKFSQAF